jgi:hypothetical protein
VRPVMNSLSRFSANQRSSGSPFLRRPTVGPFAQPRAPPWGTGFIHFDILGPTGQPFLRFGMDLRPVSSHRIKIYGSGELNLAASIQKNWRVQTEGQYPLSFLEIPDNGPQWKRYLKNLYNLTSPFPPEL